MKRSLCNRLTHILPAVQLDFIDFSKKKKNFFRSVSSFSSLCLRFLAVCKTFRCTRSTIVTHIIRLIHIYIHAFSGDLICCVVCQAHLYTLFCYFVMVSLRPINFHTLISFAFFYRLFSLILWLLPMDTYSPSLFCSHSLSFSTVAFWNWNFPFANTKKINSVWVYSPRIEYQCEMKKKKWRTKSAKWMWTQLTTINVCLLITKKPNPYTNINWQNVCWQFWRRRSTYPCPFRHLCHDNTILHVCN